MKFTLTKNVKNYRGHTLYQIQALKDFGTVKKNDLGGWVERESNLSQEDNCWVYDNAKVYDNAQVYGDAQIHDNAKINDNAKVYDKVSVCGNAEVTNNAEISGHARLYGNSQISGDVETDVSLIMGDNAKIGSHIDWVEWPLRLNGNAYITKDKDILSIATLSYQYKPIFAFRCEDNSVRLICDNFNGTLEDFKQQVDKIYYGVHTNKEYKALIALIEAHFWYLREKVK